MDIKGDTKYQAYMSYFINQATSTSESKVQGEKTNDNKP